LDEKESKGMPTEYFVPSVSRALKILELLAQSQRGFPFRTSAEDLASQMLGAVVDQDARECRLFEKRHE
jgi:hypothetical protein